jgi:hypothetical protein
MKYGLFIAFLFISIYASAQFEPTDFGQISPSDFSRNEFPDASSVILFDITKFTYEHRAYIYPIIERHLRIKINRRDAFETWGNYSLGNSIAECTKVRAATYYLENGKLVTSVLERDDIIKDKKSSNEKIFTLSNLREGCIVELSFTATYFYNISPDHRIQYDVPVLWSEYILAGTRPLTCMIVGGIEPFIYDDSYKMVQKRWVFRNVPAFKEENSMPSKRNFYARLEFFLPHENWTVVSKGFLKRHFVLHEKFQTRVVKKKAEELTVGMTDDLDKVRAIVMFVKNNFEWNGIHDFFTYDLNEVYEKKKGSSGDLNTLLHTMLQEVGFNPTLVLLSTQSHGTIRKEIPSDDQFNYVVSKLVIGEKTLFLDATNPLLPFDVLPLDCVNTEGFEMVGPTFNWINILPSKTDKVNANARLVLAPDLTLKGRVTIQSHCYQALEKRKEYKALGHEDFVKKNAVAKWVVDSAKVLNETKLDQPFQETYFVTIPDQIMETPERLYLDPFILLSTKENIWKDDTRTYPIDLRIPTEKLLVVTLTLPDGFSVEALPPKQTMSMKDNSMRCSFNVAQSNNILVITYHLSVNKIWFSRDEYPHLRDFQNQIISRQNQPIILLKGRM